MRKAKLTFPDIVKACKEYYDIEGNGCGGHFHIVLDDGNLEKHHIEWCLRQAEFNKDEKGIALGKILLMATKTQRAKLYKNYALYA